MRGYTADTSMKETIDSIAPYIDRIDAYLESLTAPTGPETTSYSYLLDEFAGGLFTDGNIGNLAWGLGGTATVSAIAEVQHQGIRRVTTPATASTYGSVYLSGAVVLPAQFDATFIVRLNTNDNQAGIRVGFGSDPSLLAQTNAVYFEKAFADTSWFANTRAASVDGRTTMSVATSTNWLTMRIRKVPTGWGFSINGGTEVVRTANLPANGVTLAPIFQIATNTTAAKSADIDYFAMGITGLTRA